MKETVHSMNTNLLLQMMYSDVLTGSRMCGIRVI